MRIRDIPLKDLRVSRLNPRRGVGDVGELAASIEILGILQPVVVTPDGANGSWLVLAGQRRLEAAKLAGLKSVPCVIRERLGERDREVLMLMENVHRVALSPVEEAAVYARLMKIHGLNQREVARAVGLSESKVSVYLALLRLPSRILRQLDAVEISIDEALGLGRYRDPLTKHAPRGLGVSLHRLGGHDRWKPGKCEIAAIRRQLSAR